MRRDERDGRDERDEGRKLEVGGTLRSRLEAKDRGQRSEIGSRKTRNKILHLVTRQRGRECGLKYAIQLSEGW
jgi:hypothetical protein